MSCFRSMMKYVSLALVAAVTTTVTPSANAAQLVYNDFYQHFNSASSLVKAGATASDDVASWAYATNSADAFGGIATFANPGNKPQFELQTGSVLMSNWYGAPNTGASGATPTYSNPFTLELYKVDRTGSDPAAGDLITSVTHMQPVQGRQVPTSGNASFAGNGTDFVMSFDLGGVVVPSEVLFLLSFDISDIKAGEPLGALNIAAVRTGKTPEASVGTAPTNDVFWRSDQFTNGDVQRFDGGTVFSRFTGTAIPEPASVTLLGLGALALFKRRR